jgi:microcystin-dependent protein
MCADTITSHYHWVKPEISGSPTTWGVKVNADLDLIDSQLFTTNAQSLVGDTSVGDIKMFAGATPPPNWKLCDGTVYANSDIPLLAPVLANRYGGTVGLSNAVPDLRGIFPVGAKAGVIDLGATGGEATHTLVTAEMPSHTHVPTITDPGHHHAYEETKFISAVVLQTGTTYSTLQEQISQTEDEVTGITIVNATTGGDGAHQNMPPYVGVNFVIKFQ